MKHQNIYYFFGNLFHLSCLMNEELLIDEKFIRKLKQGDVKSYRMLYDAIASPMKLVCMRYVKIEADAEDVFQDSFLKIYTCINQLKNSNSFVGWMKRIFINASLDHLKNKPQNTPFEDIPEGSYNENLLDSYSNESIELDGENKDVNFDVIRNVDFSQEDMLNALSNIPEHFRTVFQLFVIDHFKHKEIASVLEINVKTSKTRLLRARGLLKIELKRMAILKMQNG